MLAYGLVIWSIWALRPDTNSELTLLAFEQLSVQADVATSAWFVSMKLVVLATMILAFAVHYVRKVTESSFKEGLLVGLGWTAILIAFDIGHLYSLDLRGLLLEPFDVGSYFITDASLYIVVPVTTVLVMGYLKRKG